jgi:hypothetical protein
VAQQKAARGLKKFSFYIAIFIPLEAGRGTSPRFLTGFNAPRELLTGFTT